MAKFDPFSKHKRHIWQQLCERIDADFFRGKWTKPDRIEAYHGNWLITIDTYTVDKAIFTRIRAPYINRDDFTFRIIREHVGHKIAKVFGMEDIEVGYPDFDRDFVIQGSDERKLRMMFANPAIRELISFQPKIHLELRRKAPLFHKPKFPDDVNELFYQVHGILRDIEQLHDLYDLFGFCLDHLCAIGTAYEDDPHFGYY